MRSERGFALIASLWLVVLLGAVGLELSREARTHRLGVLATVEGARAGAAAEGGLAQVTAELERALTYSRDLVGTSPGAVADPWRALLLGGGDTVTIGVARVALAYADLGRRLQLNRATEDEARRVLVALRVDAGKADVIAQSLLDWRDSDDLPRGRGAEREAYLTSASVRLPRNALLADVSELRYVHGMTEEIYDRVAPYVTVHGTGLVNLNAAPRPVLLALPGVGEAMADVIERRQRSGRPIASVDELPLELPPALRARFVETLPQLAARITLTARELDVVSTGWLPGSPVRREVRAVVLRGGTGVYVTERRGS
jgi:general secretion pathway protein K